MDEESSVAGEYAPHEDEEFMSKRQQEYFKAKLLTWKGELLAESRVTIEDMKEDPGKLADNVDQASEETSKTVLLRTRERQRKLIAKIDQALGRIENGEFGYCLETGRRISLRRLMARPIATLCLEAQERHERQEKVFWDD